MHTKLCGTVGQKTRIPANKPVRRFSRTAYPLLALVLILLVQGCTNSRLIISPVYNRLDDRMREEFNKLADFNQQQTADFEARLGTYHVWHRQSELPQYAQLMRTVVASITNADTTEDDVKLWMETAEARTQALRECHPINFSFDLMRTLSDEQFDFIQARFNKEQTKNRERFKSRTRKERVARRLKNTVKWAGRIGLDFNAGQRAMLESAFLRQVSLRTEYYALSADWNSQFFNLARNQDNPSYENDLQNHLHKLWSLLETAHTEQWQANRDLWQETGFQIIDSMSSSQRTAVSRWVTKMSVTLDTISGYEPSFKVVNDPALGCLVNPEST